MADITLTVDVSSLTEASNKLKNFNKAVNGLSVNSLINGVQSLQGRIKQLVDAQEKGTIKSKTYNLGLKEIKRAYEELGYSSQKATSMVRAYAAELQRQNAARQAAEAARELARAQDEAALASQRLAQRHQELRMRFVDGYAANQRYRQSVNDLKEAYRAGIIPTLEVYKQKLRELRQIQQQQLLINRGNVAGTNNLGVAMQQIGYQVGDFAVQVQSGTNYFVAFGQQATQLVGIMYLLPPAVLASKVAFLGLKVSVAAIAMTLGIAIPVLTAFGAAWWRAKQQAEEAKKALDPLEQRLKSIDSVIANWNFDKQAQILNIDPDVYAGLKGLEKALDDLNKAKDKLSSFSAGSGGIVDVGNLELGGTENVVQNVTSDTKALTAATEAYESAFKRVALLRQKLAEESKITYLAERKQLEDTAALEIARSRYGNDSLAVKKLIAKQERDAYEQSLKDKKLLEDEIVSLLQVYDETKRAKEEAEKLSGAMQSAYAVYAKTRAEATLLANETARAVAALASMSFEFSPGGQALNKYGSRGVSSDTRLLDQYGNPIERLRDKRPKARPTDVDFGVPDTKKGSGGSKKEQDDYLKSLLDEANQKLKLVGLTEEQTRRQEIIFELEKKKLPVDEARIEQVLKAEEALRKATEAEQRRQDMIDSVTNNIENAFMSMIDGSKSVGDAFKSMLREILLDIYRQQVAKPFASGIGNLLGGFLGGGNLFGGASWSANGNIFKGGNIVPFAKGGVVGGPTMFPMPAGRTGVMGESGPEAIMPLKRGKDGKLGVQVDGNSQGPVVVNQTFNFAANGDESVKRIIAEAAPKIAQMTQQQIMDSRRRGGQMKATFG